ncbi:MAG: substrate-binding domain-containing protein [Alphaproteobacteria bacterium]|nr:substrate-binding domain-containing protein [Alphaproteobacteria bacterium]
MLKLSRHKRILSVIQAEGSVELAELARMMPEVSRVTLRRDIAELAEAGSLKRTHGGAVLPDATVVRMQPAQPQLVASEELSSALDDLDAIILPPVSGRGADALRRQITRTGMPYLAESAEQAGGTYLGPDNRAAGLELGREAGRAKDGGDAVALLICQPELANTRARADGFEAGLREAMGPNVELLRVNGQGNYRQSLRVALDAFKSRPEIDMVFGVNDHSALAGIEAAERTDTCVRVYATGGESPEFVGRLAEGGALHAVAAFFPDVVGVLGIDLIAEALAGRPLPEAAITPHRILNRDTLDVYYAKAVNGAWRLRDEQSAALVGERRNGGRSQSTPDFAKRGRIGFMPHYPAHDWYRTMIQSMTARAAEYGFGFQVSPPHKGISAEISRLRSKIADSALSCIQPGQTVIVGEGEATLCLAEALRGRAAVSPESLSGVTVITNALDVLYRLEPVPWLKVILTSGEYQKADRCLVGPSLGSLFERMRADLAFLSVAGVSPDFGFSAVDERLALANSRFVQAARRTIALADHTTIGADANHRIARSGEVHCVITDDGALPVDRQRLRATGIDVLIVGEDEDTALQNSSADATSAQVNSS